MTQTLFTALIWFAVAAAASWILTGLALPYLHAWGRIDRPNSRSSHSASVPRGGGIAIVATLVVPLAITVWLATGGSALAVASVLLAFIGLAAVSWRDDRESLPVLIRLVTQLAAVVLGFVAIPSSGLVFQGYLPAALDHAIVLLGWLWFINLYNFMDGIDGIAGVETAMLGWGVALLIALFAGSAAMSLLALMMAGAACGFLFWNWTPARLFMGDVGSIPLGFLAGFLLIYLAKEGHVVPALILPMYYLVDATTTLLIRVACREPVWEAHRQHAYQIAAAATSHLAVVTKVAALNVGLAALAVTAVRHAGQFTIGMACLAAALAATGAFYLWLRSSGRVTRQA